MQSRKPILPPSRAVLVLLPLTLIECVRLRVKRFEDAPHRRDQAIFDARCEFGAEGGSFEGSTTSGGTGLVRSMTTIESVKAHTIGSDYWQSGENLLRDGSNIIQQSLSDEQRRIVRSSATPICRRFSAVADDLVEIPCK